LELGRVPPTETIPESFWIEPLPSNASKAFETLASFGQNYYSTVLKPTSRTRVFDPKQQASALNGSMTKKQRTDSTDVRLGVKKRKSCRRIKVMSAFARTADIY